MKKVLLTAVSLTALAGSAFAADLPSIKSAPVAPVPIHTWSGLYAGLNVGYGFGNNALEQGSMVEYPNGKYLGFWNKNQSPTGVVGGGQIGYNYQVNPWLVVGGEADIQASDMNSSRSYYTTGVAYSIDRIFINTANSIDWFGTARGRIGVTVPSYSNIFVYGTGGFAYGYVNNTVGIADIWSNSSGSSGFSGSSTYGDTKLGWTAGGGLEWSPSSFPAWSAKVEYLYLNLGSLSQNINTTYQTGQATCCAFVATQTTPTQFQTVRVGLNWHFNPFVGTPIAAKY